MEVSHPVIRQIWLRMTISRLYLIRSLDDDGRLPLYKNWLVAATGIFTDDQCMLDLICTRIK
ncbi:uncharacterized protein PHALS_15212 [Plasmopara halstedii]|uniref:Uncharacterized protein n=1 Tax=Plasmopara halstedii TaxID=4781 RepID=A0A0P1B4C9_PLAHL|nr:uncharacterized protein PHALS_15212 [Plasmopara halstedii]CEG49351.1 hypothetical protein PHALS_15212 [Plasmopara halstedii]|eukprot:XP_024585720.1 hypothetical protein PHALS_15212 [Plasmopara halstedii]